MRLEEALPIIVDHLTDEVVVHANGMISRESFALKDRSQNFYMIGSMGLASSIALGIALTRPERRVVVFDGDGNLLMNLGSLAMAGAYQPRNFLHIVFDNGVHGSTGNQATIAQKVSLAELARAAGYRRVSSVQDEATLRRCLPDLLKQKGPLFLHVQIGVGEGERNVGRVTHAPPEMTKRLRGILGAEP